MKNKIKSAVFLLALLVCTTALFTTCEENYTGKYEITDGTPTIYFVRPTNAANKDSLLTGAPLGETICIVGDNLTSVQELYFNDRMAFLNINFITKNTLIVTVPSELPGETTNKIYFVNKAGVKTEYDFTVLMPVPLIRRIVCEHVPEGGNVVLSGDYFFDDDPENFPVQVRVGTYVIPSGDIIDIQKTSLTFKAPPADITGQIQITTMYGTGLKSQQIFRDLRGLITGFEEGQFNEGGWGRPTPAQLQEDPEFVLMGRYLRFEGTLTGGGDGFDGNQGYNAGMIANLWSSSNSNLSDPLFSSDPLTSILKFEAYVVTPWSASPLIVMFDAAGTDESWCWADENGPRGFWVPWLATGSYVGAGWETVSIPLADCKYSGNGTDIGASKAFGQLGIAVHNRGMATYAGTACSPVILIDNIRVIPGE